MIGAPPWELVVYVTTYAAAVLACAAGLVRARSVNDDETRRGLVWLLVTSGGWALFELAFLVAPTRTSAYAAYLASLVVGLTTIGAWLYFCSAYTGRSFHRDRSYRLAAVVVYAVIIAVKLTNPIHGLYFSTMYVTAPFEQLTIQHGVIHWLVTGLSYALAAIGFFMLYELFLEADYDTRPLAAVVGVTALPVLFDIVGYTTPRLLDINYEPIGVAVFAVGVLYVFDQRFLAAQLTSGVEESVVYLDDDGRIREFNDRASETFPSLSDAVGEPLDAVLPSVASALDRKHSVVERTVDSESRYYLASETSVSLGQTGIGRLVVFSDVTETERQRRELRRHNDQLEGFASAIRHELLNSLQIVDGRVKVAGEALTDGNVSGARDSLSTASAQTDQMSEVVDDLADLARYGKTTDADGFVDVSAVAREALDDADASDLALTTEAGDVEADEPRLHDLFENAFSFATHNGASTVSLTLRSDGFAITDDGDPTAGMDSEAYFDYGGAVPDSAAGMTLPNLQMLARTQGWDATIDTEYTDGIRIVVSGVRVSRPAQ